MNSLKLIVINEYNKPIERPSEDNPIYVRIVSIDGAFIVFIMDDNTYTATEDEDYFSDMVHSYKYTHYGACTDLHSLMDVNILKKITLHNYETKLDVDIYTRVASRGDIIAVYSYAPYKAGIIDFSIVTGYDKESGNIDIDNIGMCGGVVASLHAM